MDIETYNDILTKKGEDPNEIPDDYGIGEKLTRADIAFKHDLICEKAVWYNELKPDWHAFLKNYHPLYSICAAPKEHPYSRGERLVVFICDMGFAAVLSIFVAIVSKWFAESASESDTEGALLLSIYWHVIASICCGLIKAIAHDILKYIAICPCCQTISCGNTCRSIWECIGHCLMCIWSCFVCLLFVLFVWFAVGDGILDSFIKSFIISNISGWIFSFFILSACFKIAWKKEKTDEKKLEKLEVTYIDYEKYEKGNDLEVPLITFKKTNEEQNDDNNVEEAVMESVQCIIAPQQSLVMQPNLSR